MKCLTILMNPDVYKRQVPSKTGTADYYIQGAETLELEIYSTRGTYASMENGIWRLGSKESVSYENIVRCYYDRQKDMPFFEKGGDVYKRQVLRCGSWHYHLRYLQR